MMIIIWTNYMNMIQKIIAFGYSVMELPDKPKGTLRDSMKEASERVKKCTS